jgi:L-fucose mutarotase
MLEGIDPLLTGELLWRLDAMGHADSLAVVDAHFPQPADGLPLLVYPGVTATALARAIRTVLPLDPEVPPAMMQAPGGPLPVQRELADAVGADPASVAYLERAAFYARAGAARLVIRTGETRPFGNLLIAKGLVTDAGAVASQG